MEEQEKIQKLREKLNPEEFKEIVGSILPDRYSGQVTRPTWGEGTVSTYYKESYARELAIFLDKMIETKKDVVFRYKSFPTIKRTTLKQMIFSAFLWLVDEEKRKFENVEFESDEEKEGVMKYTTLRKVTNVIATHAGVFITYTNRKTFLTGKGEMFSDPTVESTKLIDDDITEFLEKGRPGQKLDKKNLNLTAEKVQAIKDSLYGIPGIMFKVVSDHVLIIKENENKRTSE